MTIEQTTDAQLGVNNVTGTIDISIDSSGDITTVDFFDTGIIVGVFAERRASSSEVPVSRRRRGWIGNESTPEFEMGSKLWLFQQARLTRTTLNGIETAVQDGLSWLINNGYAVSVEVEVIFSTINCVQIAITIFRTNSKVEKRFFQLWENSGITTIVVDAEDLILIDGARITSEGDVRVDSEGNVRVVNI